MAKREMRIELSGEQRADGCYHLKSPDLPGFHFIVGADEKHSDYEMALNQALQIFVPQYLRAQASSNGFLEPLRCLL